MGSGARACHQHGSASITITKNSDSIIGIVFMIVQRKPKKPSMRMRLKLIEILPWEGFKTLMCSTEGVLMSYGWSMHS